MKVLFVPLYTIEQNFVCKKINKPFTSQEMDDKTRIVININGGTNTIVPSATSIVQNFYGEQQADSIVQKTEIVNTKETMTRQEQELYRYVHDVEKLHFYVKQIGNCNSAHELADVVKLMLEDGQVRKEIVVKAAFIQRLLPFATNLTSGGKVDNVRLQINNMLAARRKKEKMEMMVKKGGQ